MNPEWMYNAWVWLGVTLVAFALCTLLPICIKDERWRPRIYWFILIPVCLILIFYVYTVGLEVFRRWAINP